MRKSIKVLLLIVTFFNLSLTLFSQKTIVSGKVYDAVTKEPLPYVNISFKGTKIGAMTDTNGIYRIETYYATDTLMASFIGYDILSIKVDQDESQIIDFPLQESMFSLDEVTVTFSEEEIDPSIELFKKIIQYKKVNNREKLEAYHYKVYNKVEFDLHNISDKFKQRRVFKHFDFIFDNIDTTSDEKPFLPVLLTETISDFYYRKNPKKHKEFIHATKVSGVDNKSVSQFMGDMYQNVNVYDNFIGVFGKNFISPIANFGQLYYRYYLLDSAYIDNAWCYKMKFIPKQKQELTFEGDFWVNDTTYAIKRIEAEISPGANINFVNNLKVKQEYSQVEKEVWMLTKDQLMVDFNVTKKSMGFYGRKTSYYDGFEINKLKDEEFYEGVNNVIVADDANDKGKDYWEENRFDTLSKNEMLVYEMIDTLDKIPQIQTYIDILYTVLTGYKTLGPIELGPYFTTYSYNPVEGNRFRLGGRTSNDFSKHLELSGYGAYGLTDEEFKYGGGFRWMVSKNPRRELAAYYKDDVEQLGQSQNAFRQDNVLSSFFRRNPANKLTRVEEVRSYFDQEWFPGFNSKIMFRWRELKPLGALQYSKYEDGGDIVDVADITTTEFIYYMRFAYNEKFVSGEFDRVSLGTRSPILDAQFTYGIKGFLDGDYNYRKLVVGLKQWFPLGSVGWVRYGFEGGKIWGQLPYPILELHKGNETYYYDETAFNTMNFFEFVSDEYISGSITHHLDGFFLNKIPLMRKLKWREVVSTKGVIGRLNPKHEREMILPANMYTLETTPLVEVAVGIENIFKVLRVDALWRLTHLNNPNIVKFGIRAKFDIDF